MIAVTDTVWEFAGNNKEFLAKLPDDSRIGAHIVVEAARHGLDERTVVARRKDGWVDLWSRK